MESQDKSDLADFSFNRLSIPVSIHFSCLIALFSDPGLLTHLQHIPAICFYSFLPHFNLHSCKNDKKSMVKFINVLLYQANQVLGRTAKGPGAKPTTFYSFSNSSICFSALQFVELPPQHFTCLLFMLQFMPCTSSSSVFLSTTPLK